MFLCRCVGDDEMRCVYTRDPMTGGWCEYDGVIYHGMMLPISTEACWNLGPFEFCRDKDWDVDE